MKILTNSDGWMVPNPGTLNQFFAPLMTGAILGGARVMLASAGWLILGAAAIVGSTIGGVAGFGTGVIMIPAIAWGVGVKATVPVLTVCMLVGNSARVWFSRGEIEWRVVG